PSRRDARKPRIPRSRRPGQTGPSRDDRRRNRVLSMPQSLRVLAIHAHPDDVELQCAGTLVLLREAGHGVTIATMTPGDCGSAVHDAETIASIRREEARSSAALIDADYHCLEFRDLAIF